MKTKHHLTAAGLYLALSCAGFGQPVITQQPQSSTNLAGTTATFTVTATGTLPLAYQWQRDTGFLDFYDFADRTNATLALANVAPSDAVNYRVIITNAGGAVTSGVAHLTVVMPPQPPRIAPTTSLQHQAAGIGTSASFAVTALGTPPLAYQWCLDGHELPAQTNRNLAFSAVHPTDEGDYTVVVTNAYGAVTSSPARLWVVPPGSALVRSNFTNSLGRLPYWYVLPTNYSAARTYPLTCLFHGTPGDESLDTTNNNPASYRVMVSYQLQQRDPVILVLPERRAGDESWTASYLSQTSALLDQWISRFSVDTNRIYLGGFSEGLHAAWDLIALRPGRFAGAILGSGWQGNSPAGSVKDVPVWTWCAEDDDAGQWGNTQQAVRALRAAGGSVRYTEYVTGGHGGALDTGRSTPAVVDWLLAQRLGAPSMAPPSLTITNPTPQAVWPTGATNLSLAGSALALDQDVTRVAWTNTANRATGVATGSNAWSIVSLPLTLNQTNGIIVTGATTSWAPACGGNTTFNDTLMVVCYPIQATLALQGTNALLNWTGGGPPYRIQRAIDLIAADWTDVLSNATPPVTLPLADPVGFYRIVGQ